MQLTTANHLFAAALVAGTLFTAPAQAQSSAVGQYKLMVDSTLVLGETTEKGLLRVLNNGPANAEVRWFDPKAGNWDSQVLEAGESLLSERGHVVHVSKNTLVCLLGQSADKDKAGYRGTSGYYSMPLVPIQDKDEVRTGSTKDVDSNSKGKGVCSKDKQVSKKKPASKSKPEVKTKGGESKSVAALIDEDGDGGDDSGDGESTGIKIDVLGHLMIESSGIQKDVAGHLLIESNGIQTSCGGTQASCTACHATLDPIGIQNSVRRSLFDGDGDGGDDSGDGESTGIKIDVAGHLMIESTGLYKDRGKSSPKIAHG